MALWVVRSSWSSASMQLHGADHTGLSLECSGWSCDGWLSTLSGVHLRARIAPSYRYELLDLTFLFPNSHLVLAWRLWFCFVCLLLHFWEAEAKLSFGGLRCILDIYAILFQYGKKSDQSCPSIGISEAKLHWADKRSSTSLCFQSSFQKGWNKCMFFL